MLELSMEKFALPSREELQAIQTETSDLLRKELGYRIEHVRVDSLAPFSLTKTRGTKSKTHWGYRARISEYSIPFITIIEVFPERKLVTLTIDTPQWMLTTDEIGGLTKFQEYVVHNNLEGFGYVAYQKTRTKVEEHRGEKQYIIGQKTVEIKTDKWWYMVWLLMAHASTSAIVGHRWDDFTNFLQPGDTYMLSHAFQIQQPYGDIPFTLIRNRVGKPWKSDKIAWMDRCPWKETHIGDFYFRNIEPDMLVRLSLDSGADTREGRDICRSCTKQLTCLASSYERPDHTMELTS